MGISLLLCAESLGDLLVADNSNSGLEGSSGLEMFSSLSPSLRFSFLGDDKGVSVSIESWATVVGVFCFGLSLILTLLPLRGIDAARNVSNVACLVGVGVDAPVFHLGVVRRTLCCS